MPLLAIHQSPPLIPEARLCPSVIVDDLDVFWSSLLRPMHSFIGTTSGDVSRREHRAQVRQRAGSATCIFAIFGNYSRWHRASAGVDSASLSRNRARASPSIEDA